jgi:Signal transduction histidine kinase
MTRFLLIFCFFVCLTSLCAAQLPIINKGYADSISQLLQKEKNDSVKSKLNFLLFYSYLNTDTAKARQHLMEGRRYGQKYPLMFAQSYAHEGYYYINKDIPKSEAAYMKADSILIGQTSKDAYRIRSNAWQNYAVLQQMKDDDASYVDIVLNKAIPLGKLSGDSMLLGSEYANVANAFTNTEQYEKAEEYFNNALAILKPASKEPSRLLMVYFRTGENYINLGKYAEAKTILDSMKVLLAPYPGFEMYAGYYQVQGLYHHKMKQYDSALVSFDKGIESAGGVNGKYRIDELEVLKTETLVEQKNFAKAKELLLRLSKDEDLMSLGYTRLKIYGGLAASYAGLGNFSQAHSSLKQYSELSDSLFKTRFKRDINALEVKYKNAESQKEIIELKAKNEQTALSSKNAWLLTTLLASISIFLLVVIIFALLYYRSQKKLAARKLLEIEQQKELEVAKAMLDGEEGERRRLARDLHDGLGGMLAGVKMNLSGTANVTQDEKLFQVIHQLDNSVSELRRIARNMMPESLLNFGLETALKDMCELNFAPGLEIHFQSLGVQPNLPEKTQIIIYRIAQELLANAIKHSGANRIMLQCSQNENMFYLSIEDNGKGFDPKADRRKGLGWDNIRNRIEFLKGKIEIDSVIGEGTTINIELNVSE